MDFAGRLFKGDKVIWIIFMFLCLISLIEVFSAASTLTYKSGDHWGPITQHSVFLMVGTVIVLIIHNINYRWFQVFPVLLIPLSIGLLLWVTLKGGLINDAARWINLFGFTFQPSEIAKMGVIISVSLILSKNQEEEVANKKAFKYILIVTGVICALIVGENFSTAALLFGVVFLMMIIGRIETTKLAILFSVLILLAIAILFLPIRRSETWRNRIVDKIENRNYVPPEKYDIDENAQVAHANIAIATSGVVGKMPGNSVQRDFLPQAFSDFIFAIIIEELGLLGGTFVVFLYIWLLIRAGRIAQKCERTFPAFLVMGIALLLVAQAILNMCVAVGLFPVTGQPLPLISKGGTSTLINCVYVGMILSVSRYTILQEEMNAKAAAEAEAGNIPAATEAVIEIEDEKMTVGNQI